MNNIKKNVLLSATALGLVFAFNANAEIKVQTGDTPIDGAVLDLVRGDANIINHEPVASEYSYINPKGEEDTLENTWYPSDYKATSSADGEKVQAKDATLSYDSDALEVSDYRYHANYTNDEGKVVEGWLDGNVDVAEVTDIFTSSYQAGSKPVTASSSGTGAINIADYYYDHDNDHYTISYDEETQEYTLYKNGEAHEDADLMKSIVTGYENDVQKFAELQATLKGYYDTNVANHDAVAGVVDADNNTVNTLNANEAELERQVAKYRQDQVEYTKYPNSLSQTIDTKAYDAIDEVVGHANTAGEDEESNATGLFKADETLQANIDAEATARSEADETLQANIDAEATARSEADATLQANIDAEVTARSEADATLQANIDAEVARATAAESELDTAIKAEATRATAAESELDTAIKAEATRATGVENAINAKIGEGFDAENTVAMAIGDRTNLGSGNTAINDGVKTSVAAGLRAAGDAIGDVDFSKTNYAMGATDLSSAIRQLDASMAETQAHNEARFDAIDHRISSLRKEMREGLAATAALAGLVPLDNTYKSQLSMAMGGYENKQAVALGGFHYLKENIILNAGVSYGGSHSTAYKVGVTFGF